MLNSDWNQWSIFIAHNWWLCHAWPLRPVWTCVILRLFVVSTQYLSYQYCDSVGRAPNVCMPFMVTLFNRTVIIEWCVLKCRSKNRHQRHGFEKVSCSKMVIHSRLNSQHNLGGPIWPFKGHLMSSRIYAVKTSKIFIWAPKFVRQMALDMIWICMIQIIGELVQS